MNELSHIGNDNRPAMVDVSGKDTTYRCAKAQGHISLEGETLKLISENNIKKGNVLITAELAGINAAKQTGQLIPLCHPLILTKINVHVSLTEDGAKAVSEVKCVGQTGVEMEALTAVNIALLTIYDMCKAVDKNMEITEVKLLEKTKEKIA